MRGAHGFVVTVRDRQHASPRLNTFNKRGASPLTAWCDYERACSVPSLAEKLGRHLEELSRVAVLLFEAGELVKPRNRLTALADDVDNRILECALAGKADGIVTGDKAMLLLKSFRGIALMSLDTYLKSSRL